MAVENSQSQDEWPNFEFYPAVASLQQEVIDSRLKRNGRLRAFKFNFTLHEVLRLIHGDE